MSGARDEKGADTRDDAVFMGHSTKILLDVPPNQPRGRKIHIVDNDRVSLRKFRTADSTHSNVSQNGLKNPRSRRLSRLSIDLGAHSQISRSSQETEEDVCFPAFETRVKRAGIDFSELKDFVTGETLNSLQQQSVHLSISQNLNQDNSSVVTETLSKNALKYTPSSVRTPDICGNVPPVLDQINFMGKIPDRFSLYHTNNDATVHASNLPSLVSRGLTWEDLFKQGKPTWWLDCTCPTDLEMKVIFKTFGIHPLTAEDIRVQESREKVEIFPNYYFVSFHTFEQDNESEYYLEPIRIYMVVFKEGILTFHFSPTLHPSNVRRRARQLSGYVHVNSEWICYAFIDDITDSFAPIITTIEYEADAIDDHVFLVRLSDFGSMLRRIGECRRVVMTLMRLLSNKADVIKMFANRFSNLYHDQDPFSPMDNIQSPNHDIENHIDTSSPAKPCSEIALYLGDIQDHILTMYQSLSAYEKIFSRSQSNYLAQLQTESLNTGLAFSTLLENMTVVATIFVPLNVITGVFSLNVDFPGKGGLNYWLFIGIILFMIALSGVVFFMFKMWIKREKNSIKPIDTETSNLSIRRKSIKVKKSQRARSIVYFGEGYGIQQKID